MDKTKNENYRDFSNRKSFNNVPCSADEELVPVVLTVEMKVTLSSSGFDSQNAETWTFPNGKKVPVAFVPNKKGNMEAYMKFFNSEVERFIKAKDKIVSEAGVLSLDLMLDNINDEDESGYDPTGSTENEDVALLMMTLTELIEEVCASNNKDVKILHMLLDGYSIKEILEAVDLNKGKSQGYEYVKKLQKKALDLYNEKYR